MLNQKENLVPILYQVYQKKGINHAATIVYPFSLVAGAGLEPATFESKDPGSEGALGPAFQRLPMQPKGKKG